MRKPPPVLQLPRRDGKFICYACLEPMSQGQSTYNYTFLRCSKECVGNRYHHWNVDGTWVTDEQKKERREAYEEKRRQKYGGYRNYHEYLTGEHWRQLSCKMCEEAGFKCRLCGGREVLQVHHRTYERIGREIPSDLFVVCKACHTLIHWIVDKWPEQYAIDNTPVLLEQPELFTQMKLAKEQEDLKVMQAEEDARKRSESQWLSRFGHTQSPDWEIKKLRGIGYRGPDAISRREALEIRQDLEHRKVERSQEAFATVTRKCAEGKWQGEPATSAQVWKLKKLGYANAEALNKGEAWKLIQSLTEGLQ